MTTLCEFRFFPYLPQELQDQIWHAVLEDTVVPTLFSYTDGCWDHDLQTYPDGNWSNPSIYFHHERLHIAMSLPMAGVNSHLKSLALNWAAAHGLRRRKNYSADVDFIRDFIPESDVLCVPRRKWRKVANQLWATRRRNMQVAQSRAEVRYLAIHEDDVVAPDLYRFLEMFPKARAMYIICDAPRTIERTERWVLGPSYGGAFVWDAETGMIEFRSDEADRREGKMCETTTNLGTIDVDARRYKRIRNFASALKDEIARQGTDGFEVRPVEIIQRC
ncbi:hypothetical protein K461DRAFT_316295 [Myriangium duriaei CBS 260.36]|uniref:Uncharacterized protein n=1 Tax=Myriangium duriaei CBS 260.36 TaxID=1168546 RepID=A0A9P4IVF9_9PEZI|nr:hypothetical protein K461DRAFT_316295 [Myriangium duriaei CBS 260.36]